ncbi:hypothetical protein AND_008627 [Anopheles darlingi]|uniref:Uncharacterized protein n=1 Tax=Anopheles darlingi TaxID=43151 RepID=W5JAF9_ANODA|nr:hypothetical protein AND_008627 [Anopheles darlingi]
MMRLEKITGSGVANCNHASGNSIHIRQAIKPLGDRILSEPLLPFFIPTTPHSRLFRDQALIRADALNYDVLAILQRTTVGIGQIKIQAVATCLFLCMDTCGSVYGSTLQYDAVPYRRQHSNGSRTHRKTTGLGFDNRMRDATSATTTRITYPRSCGAQHSPLAVLLRDGISWHLPHQLTKRGSPQNLHGPSTVRTIKDIRSHQMSLQILLNDILPHPWKRFSSVVQQAPSSAMASATKKPEEMAKLRVVEAEECARLKDICHPSIGASPNESCEEHRLELTTTLRAAVWSEGPNPDPDGGAATPVRYGKEFTEDCVFNEQMEQHHYNTYSSTQHSNARRTLYLALNKTGQPRKIQIPVNRTLGKLATYTKALTQTVAHDRVEQLISRLFGADHVRHGLNQLCEAGQPLEELTMKELRPRPVCGAQTGGPKSQGGTGANGGASKQSQAASAPGKEGLRQTKKKKKRRKCRDDEVPGEHCFRHGGQGAGLVGLGTNSGGKKKAGQNQGLASHRAGSSISSGSSSSNGPSISNSSVGSSSAGDNGTSINSSANSSAASSLASSISNGGPNRQGLPYALLSTTPNARKSAKPTKKMAGSGGNRSGNGASSSSAGGSGSSQTRKPKKPAPQQQQNQQPSGFGKRNGTAGNQGKAPGSGKSKLVPVSSMVIGKVSPKPASLLSGRTPRNTTPFPTTTMTSAASTISAAVNHLEDTSQQLDDLDPSPESELDMGDVLQPSAELVDEDELDEGNLNLAGHAINFVEEEDLDDLEF